MTGRYVSPEVAAARQAAIPTPKAHPDTCEACHQPSIGDIHTCERSST